MRKFNSGTNFVPGVLINSTKQKSKKSKKSKPRTYKFKEDDWTEGFIARFILVKPDAKQPRQSIGRFQEEMGNKRNALIGRLARIYNGIKKRDKPLEVYLSDEQFKRFNDYQFQLKELVGQHPKQALIGPTYGRLPHHALTIAILLELGGYGELDEETERAKGGEDKQLLEPKELTIKDINFLRGIQFAEKCRRYAEEVLGMYRTTKSEKQIQTVYQAILNKPGISRSELLRNYHLTSKQLKKSFKH